MTDVTPLMRQYQDVKAQHPDAILFFRLGDFYEMFFEDAEVASGILEIALTTRDRHREEKVPMCGVPYHAAGPYIARLISRGFRVALCEQVEDPREAVGLVRRQVVRVITPGLVTDPEGLEAKANNFLLAVAPGRQATGLATLDISTGEFRACELHDGPGLFEEVERIAPRELVVPRGTQAEPSFRALLERAPACVVTALEDDYFAGEYAAALLCDQFRVSGLEAFGLRGMREAVRAAGGVLHYAREALAGGLAHLQPPQVYSPGQAMVVDGTTMENLEVFASLREGSRKASLLGVLDQTVTAMGGRLLRAWLTYPLQDIVAINARLDAVEEAKGARKLRHELRELLRGVHDLERLNSRVVLGHATPRDLVALKQSLQRLPALKERLGALQALLWRALQPEVDPPTELAELLERALREDAPLTTREGGIIRPGYNGLLDELMAAAREGKDWIAGLEAQERQRAGIPSLKVGFNKVFGYYIEVTRPNLHLVPPEYIRKQTLLNAERFITPDLKSYESKVLGADEKRNELEWQLFTELRDRAAAQGRRIQASAAAVARADVLLALAEVAEEGRYVRPTVDAGERIAIVEGRHPVVERMGLGERFVPNDVELDCETQQLLIITGPNMAGKSTILRQVALIVLLAQVGSCVPAREASVGVVDRIFTRVGASDNLARGQSTFMVEMCETASILRNATRRSLIILDEIGRGTSTFDGLSLAWAVAEHIHDHPRLQARTLFATHYHELTELALTRPRARNFNLAVREWNDQLIFLRKLVEGSSSRSYGIQVARLAGLPEPVIARAKEVLVNLERGEFNEIGLPRIASSPGEPPPAGPRQLGLFQREEDPLRRDLRRLDLEQLTPLQALLKLSELKEEAEREC
ncbi:MAG: DNA mismatch repair protein MutS [Deltaproteobacteria bacterium]|nr:DNA mismatch repair protein MutS [Deltaproteobacteria bacterium]